MEAYDQLLCFVGILREAFKIITKNGKLMTSIVVLTLLSYTSLFLCNFIFTKSFIRDLVIKESSLPFTSADSFEFLKLLVGIKEDVRLLWGVGWAFNVVYMAVSLFSMTASVFASAIIYSGKNLSTTELFLRIMASSRRSFVTYFYVTLLSVGYNILALASLIFLLLTLDLPGASYTTLITFSIPTVGLCLYIAIVWTLSLVISVIEEDCYGVEALGKAGRIVKGRKLQGFSLNLLFMLVCVILVQGLRIIPRTQSQAIQIIMGLFIINLIFLVNMLGLVAYTVLYYQCKKIHGEEVELELQARTLIYSTIPTASLAGEDVP